jgi:hypothetical protein
MTYMKINNFIQSAQLQESGNPVNELADNTLSFLQEYDAELIDVNITDLLYPVDRKEFHQPLKEGLKVLYSEQLKAHDQLIPVTVWKSDEGLVVLNHEALPEVMLDEGYDTITVIQIQCSLEKSKEIRLSLSLFAPNISYSVKLAAFEDTKAAVKESRNKIKATGENVPTTNELLSTVMGESQTHIKQLAKIAKRDDVEEVAKQLDRGVSMNKITTPPKPKKQAEFTICSSPEGYDMTLLCPDCPRRLSFMAEIEEKRNLTTNQNNK